MHSLTAQFLTGLRFDAEQAATLRAVGECRGRQELFNRQATEALAGLLEVAKIESSESSNRLEGVNMPLHRIRRLVVHQAQPRNRSEQVVAGHGMLYQYMPNPGGHWKSTDNEIFGHRPDGTSRVRFKTRKS